MVNYEQEDTDYTITKVFIKIWHYKFHSKNILPVIGPVSISTRMVKEYLQQGRNSIKCCHNSLQECPTIRSTQLNTYPLPSGIDVQ